MTHGAARPEVIETPRLRLRPMTADDAGPLLSVFGDPVLMTVFESAPFDRAQMDDWVSRNLRHQAEHGVGLFTVELRATGEVIGDCGLELMQVDGEPVFELGYDIRRNYWGHGYATEAARAVRDHAFASLGVTRLISMVWEGNAASRRVAEKVGMRPAETLDRHGRPYVRYEVRRDGVPVGGVPVG